MADSQQQQQQLVAAASSSQSNNDPLVTAAVDDGPQQLSFSAAASSGGGSADPAQQQQPKDKNSRWIRIVVASIKAVLFLELAGMVAGPWIASKTSRRRRRSSDTGSDSDLDPADVLMDYLTGKTSLAALQLLRNEQLSAAVDNLVTEDFAELGVNDRGREIRSIVDDIIRAREKGVDTPSSRQRQQQQQQQSEGLGRMGPLRFRNNRKKAPEVPPAAAAEAATGTKQEGDRAAAGKQ